MSSIFILLRAPFFGLSNPFPGIFHSVSSVRGGSNILSCNSFMSPAIRLLIPPYLALILTQSTVTTKRAKCTPVMHDKSPMKYDQGVTKWLPRYGTVPLIWIGGFRFTIVIRDRSANSAILAPTSSGERLWISRSALSRTHKLTISDYRSPDLFGVGWR